MAYQRKSVVDDWLDEDSLLLIECWARDGYTMKDIANKIGVANSVFGGWRQEYPEIKQAVNAGKEITDYKVENALLKSALGFRTKEVKIITTIRGGQTIETVKEVIERDQVPNVSAIQCWLYNRLPAKWKKNRDNLIELGDEDTTIHVTVTRASDNETKQIDAESDSLEDSEDSEDTEDNSWNEEKEIEITRSKDKPTQGKAKTAKQGLEQSKPDPKALVEHEPADLDEWPDDWEDIIDE